MNPETRSAPSIEKNFSGGLKTRFLLIFVWGIVGLVSIVLAFASIEDIPWLASLLSPLSHHITAEKALYSPLAYFVLLTVVYLLEQTIPARIQRTFSVSARQDFLWYFAAMFFRVVLTGAYTSLIYVLYHQHLSFLTIAAIAGWPSLARFVVAVLLADFLRWFSHLVRHKVHLLWHFHAVHHSQQELNLFTDARSHPVDSMVSATIRLFPLLLFDNAFPVILGWVVFETVYPKFYHGNIRLNLGPLKYILVTPQSHRVHHGKEKCYHDKNFGFIFCIWDRIFGTHYENDNAYPDTGIPETEFPHEISGDVASLGRTLWNQLLYPFGACVRQFRTSSPTDPLNNSEPKPGGPSP